MFASDVYYTCSSKDDQGCVACDVQSQHEAFMFIFRSRLCFDGLSVMFVTTCIHVLKIVFLFARDVYYNMSRVSVSRSKLYFYRLLVMYITTCIFVIKILSF